MSKTPNFVQIADKLHIDRDTEDGVASLKDCENTCRSLGDGCYAATYFPESDACTMFKKEGDYKLFVQDGATFKTPGHGFTHYRPKTGINSEARIFDEVKELKNCQNKCTDNCIAYEYSETENRCILYDKGDTQAMFMKRKC